MNPITRSSTCLKIPFARGGLEAQLWPNVDRQVWSSRALKLPLQIGQRSRDSDETHVANLHRKWWPSMLSFG